MYYLLNEGNQIIGADKKFINYLNLTDLDSFRSAILLNEMKIVKTSNIVSIETKNKKESYFFSESEADTLIGSFKLIYLNKIVEEEEDVNPNIINFPVFAERVGLDQEDYLDFVQEFIELSIDLRETISNSSKDVYQKGIEKILNLSEMLYLTSVTKDLTNIDSLSKSKKKESINSFYDKLDDLLHTEEVVTEPSIDNKEEISLDLDLAEEPEKLVEVVKEVNDDLSIDLDLSEEPKKIVEPEKLVEVVKEVKDDLSIDLDLSEEPKKIVEVVKEIKEDLVDLDLSEEPEKIVEVVKEVKEDLVDLDLSDEPEDLVEVVKEVKEDLVDLDLSDTEPDEVVDIVEEKAEETENYVRNGFSLDDVESVHFDFQISKAANDLGIPEDIIEEFVEEYIEQAETETVNMIEAYRKDDLKTIQEIGHLLKGAASNLRIEPLAETLYDIQFCENIELIEGLTKTYWAKFLSLKSQIKK